MVKYAYKGSNWAFQMKYVHARKFTRQLYMGVTMEIRSVCTVCKFLGGGGGGGGSRGGGEGRGGGGNLGVILVRVCEPVFQNLPHSYTWPSKKRAQSYT